MKKRGTYQYGRKFEKNFASPHSYSFNHESDEMHSCGLKQGQSPPCRVPCSYYQTLMLRHKVGDLIVYRVDPPGTGRYEWRITRMDSTGVYGIIVFDSVRELEISDVI